MKPISTLILLGLASGSHTVAAADKDQSWSYAGKTGPEHWGELKPEFKTCKTGSEQSPIDIKNAEKEDLKPIAISYNASAAEIVNTGYTIQAHLKEGGFIELDDSKYELIQLHFHTPSEIKLDGKSYPLTVHLVHKNADGKLAVVAVLMEEGKANSALEKVISNMPAKAGVTNTLDERLKPENFLPENRAYYSFMGSLTTPPCTEDVQWRVMKNPVEVSQEQLVALKKLYPMNARPVQPLNGRKVEVSG